MMRDMLIEAAIAVPRATESSWEGGKAYCHLGQRRLAGRLGLFPHDWHLLLATEERLISLLRRERPDIRNQPIRGVYG
jgi:hypothetical protein